MSRIYLTMAVAVAISAGSAGIANAQCAGSGVLTSAQGTVLINRGAGFVPGAVGTTLPNGTQLSVQGPGSAVVDYGSGNLLTVPASTTVSVRPPGCGGYTNAGVGQVFVTTAIIGGIVGASVAVNDNNGGRRVPISP